MLFLVCIADNRGIRSAVRESTPTSRHGHFDVVVHLSFLLFYVWHISHTLAALLSVHRSISRFESGATSKQQHHRQQQQQQATSDTIVQHKATKKRHLDQPKSSEQSSNKSALSCCIFLFFSCFQCSVFYGLAENFICKCNLLTFFLLSPHLTP